MAETSEIAISMLIVGSALSMLLWDYSYHITAVVKLEMLEFYF